MTTLFTGDASNISLDCSKGGALDWKRRVLVFMQQQHFQSDYGRRIMCTMRIQVNLSQDSVSSISLGLDVVYPDGQVVYLDSWFIKVICRSIMYAKLFLTKPVSLFNYLFIIDKYFEIRTYFSHNYISRGLIAYRSMNMGNKHSITGINKFFVVAQLSTKIPYQWLIYWIIELYLLLILWIVTRKWN